MTSRKAFAGTFMYIYLVRYGQLSQKLEQVQFVEALHQIFQL